jgi:hypothetical protein
MFENILGYVATLKIPLAPLKKGEIVSNSTFSREI